MNFSRRERQTTKGFRSSPPGTIAIPTPPQSLFGGSKTDSSGRESKARESQSLFDVYRQRCFPHPLTGSASASTSSPSSSYASSSTSLLTNSPLPYGLLDPEDDFSSISSYDALESCSSKYGEDAGALMDSPSEMLAPQFTEEDYPYDSMPPGTSLELRKLDDAYSIKIVLPGFDSDSLTIATGRDTLAQQRRSRYRGRLASAASTCSTTSSMTVSREYPFRRESSSSSHSSNSGTLAPPSKTIHILADAFVSHREPDWISIAQADELDNAMMTPRPREELDSLCRLLRRGSLSQDLTPKASVRFDHEVWDWSSASHGQRERKAYLPKDPLDASTASDESVNTISTALPTVKQPPDSVVPRLLHFERKLWLDDDADLLRTHARWLEGQCLLISIPLISTADTEDESLC